MTADPRARSTSSSSQRLARPADAHAGGPSPPGGSGAELELDRDGPTGGVDDGTVIDGPGNDGRIVVGLVGAVGSWPEPRGDVDPDREWPGRDVGVEVEEPEIVRLGVHGDLECLDGPLQLGGPHGDERRDAARDRGAEQPAWGR